MMDFIMMTISFTVAILLASAIGVLIMTNPKVMKLYTKHVVKSMSIFDEILVEDVKDL